MFPVLIPVGRVHHQEVFILFKAIEIGIVNSSSGSIRDEGILGPRCPDVERGRIIGQDMLQEFQGVSTPDDEPTHMRYIKQPRSFSGG